MAHSKMQFYAPAKDHVDKPRPIKTHDEIQVLYCRHNKNICFPWHKSATFFRGRQRWLILNVIKKRVLLHFHLFINENHLFIIFDIQILENIQKKIQKMLKRQDTIERDVVVFEFTKNSKPPAKPEPTVIEEVRIFRCRKFSFVTIINTTGNLWISESERRCFMRFSF